MVGSYCKTWLSYKARSMCITTPVVVVGLLPITRLRLVNRDVMQINIVIDRSTAQPEYGWAYRTWLESVIFVAICWCLLLLNVSEKSVEIEGICSIWKVVTLTREKLKPFDFLRTYSFKLIPKITFNFGEIKSSCKVSLQKTYVKKVQKKVELTIHVVTSHHITYIHSLQSCHT